MSTLSISLRALCHPITLLNISRLPLNEHLLKSRIPTPFAGKPRDFAGALFFQFLLITVLSFPSVPLPLRSHTIAAVAIGTITIWFSSTTTALGANTLIVSGMKHFLNLSIQIVRESLDVIALVVLWSAWRLLRRLERIPIQRPSGKVTLAVLGLASFATLAIDCSPPYHVRHLVLYQGGTYTSWHGNIAVSNDGGLRWQITYSPNLPSNILDSLEQSVELPVVVCAPEDDQRCYRVTGEEVVEISEDGGRTWQVTWRIPSGRRRYMERFSDVRHCMDSPEMGPYDLVVIEDGNSHRVVVAMGNQGVLVGSNGKNWERVEVLQFSASPTPFRAQNPLAILLDINIEASLLLMISIFTLVGFTSWGLTCFLKFRRAWPMLIFAALISSLTAISVYGLTRSSFYYPSKLLLPPLILSGVWIMISLTRKPKESHISGRISIRIALEIFLLGILPLVLWTFGVIPWYELALIVSICVVISIIISGIRRMRKAIR